MPAKVIAPLTGDTVSIPQGGAVMVTSRYDYNPTGTLRCFVAAFSDMPHSLFGRDFHAGPVTYVAMPGTYANQVVKLQTNGVDEAGPQTITVVVRPNVATEALTQASRSTPVAPPAVGVPINYILYGTAEANVAYITVALSAWPDANADKTPIAGVFVLPQPDRSWAGEVIVPNAADTAYLARVIRFDKNDNVIRTTTVVLR
jgi:hypothetical protein